MNKKILILIIDALPYEQFINYGYNYIPNLKRKDIIKLETLIGYSSGLYPSIWTGIYPDKLNYWTEFKFDINNSIKGDQICSSSIVNRILNILPYMPSLVSKIFSVFFAQLSLRLNLFSYNYPGNFDFKLKNKFTYEEHQKFILHPEKSRNKNQATIFSILRKKKISYRFLWTSQLIKDFSIFKEDIIFYYNSIMDSLGHKYGPNSVVYRSKINRIFKWVNKLIPYYKLILFSDHGMTRVTERFYPLKIFKKMDLKLHKDLIVWFDSTILRIWFNSKKSLKSKSRLIKQFNKTNSGHFLTNKEKETYGLNFKNRYFGDLIFLINPGYEIIPNFFNFFSLKRTPGLHGYIPIHKSSYGLFYSNFIDYKDTMNIIEINKILIHALKIS